MESVVKLSLGIKALVPGRVVVLNHGVSRLAITRATSFHLGCSFLLTYRFFYDLYGNRSFEKLYRNTLAIILKPVAEAELAAKQVKSYHCCILTMAKQGSYTLSTC